MRGFTSRLKRDSEVDGEVVGLDHDKVPEVKCLGRIVRATPQGLEIEADKRLALKIVDEAKLVGGKGVDNPGGVVEAKGGARSCTEFGGVNVLSPKRSDDKFLGTRSRRFVLCK